MFTEFEIKKTASAILCTLLFSTTCVLSAVGPARAIDTASSNTVVAASLSPAVTAPLA